MSIEQENLDRLEHMKVLMLAQRITLLDRSDWTQMADSALSAEKKAAWATYRQALRDVPSQEGFPENIQWPTKPE